MPRRKNIQQTKEYHNEQKAFSVLLDQAKNDPDWDQSVYFYSSVKARIEYLKNTGKDFDPDSKEWKVISDKIEKEYWKEIQSNLEDACWMVKRNPSEINAKRFTKMFINKFEKILSKDSDKKVQLLIMKLEVFVIGFMMDFLEVMGRVNTDAHAYLTIALRKRYKKARMNIEVKRSGQSNTMSHTISFTWCGTPEQLEDLYNNCIKKGLIDKETILDRFKDAFSPSQTDTSISPIKWTKPGVLLSYFIYQLAFNKRLIEEEDLNKAMQYQFGITRARDKNKWYMEKRNPKKHVVIDRLLDVDPFY